VDIILFLTSNRNNPKQDNEERLKRWIKSLYFAGAHPYHYIKAALYCSSKKGTDEEIEVRMWQRWDQVFGTDDLAPVIVYRKDFDRFFQTFQYIYNA
jgi:hypothetical protein